MKRGLCIAKRRGYALPLVLLLGLASAISVTIMLEHQTRLRMAENRVVNAYVAHHSQQGLAMVAEIFLKSLRRNARGAPNVNSAQAASERAEADRDPDPIIRFSLVFPIDGSRADFELRDAQGTVLDDVSGDSGAVMSHAAAYLSAREGGRRFLRQRGPIQVNINTAPREVLEQIIEHGAPGGRNRPADIALELIRRREDRRLDMGSLRLALSEAGIEKQYLDVFMGYDDTTMKPATHFAGMFVTEPTLRRLTVTVFSPTSVPLKRFVGLVLYDTTVGATGNKPGMAFLAWEETPATENTR